MTFLVLLADEQTGCPRLRIPIHWAVFNHVGKAVEDAVAYSAKLSICPASV